jgi:hypothetical protein
MKVAAGGRSCRRQNVPALLSPPAKRITPPGGAHADPEAMRFRSPSAVWLKRSLHSPTPI